MATRRYSAGRIFLDVVPSFKNVMRDIEREAEGIRKRINAQDEKATVDGAKKTAKAAAKERVDAEREANETIEAERSASHRKMTLEERREAAERYRAARDARERFDQQTLKGDARKQDRLAKANAQNLANMERGRRAAAKRAEADAEQAEKAARSRRITVQTLEQQETAAAWRKGLREQVREHTDAAKEMHSVTAKRHRADIDSMKDWDKEFSKLEKQQVERGKLMGGRFAQEMREGIDRALQDMGPSVDLDVDSRPAVRKVEDIRERLLALRDQRVGIDIDAGRARREILSLERDADRLGRSHIDIDIRTNARSAAMALKALRREQDAATRAAGQLTDRHNRNRDSAMDTANAFRFFQAIILGLLIVLPMLIPAIAGLTAALGGLIPMILGAGTGLGVLILGFLGVGKAVSALSDVQQDAAKDTLQTSRTMRNASRAIRDAEQGLEQARTRAAEAAEDAARRVADAQRNLADAHETAQERMAAAVERQKDAQQAVIDAQEAGAERIRDALERQKDAQQAVIDARRDAADAIQNALARQARAENTLERAQRTARNAQEALAQARRNAQREMEDLAIRQAGGQLAERAARLALFEAEGAYRTIMKDGTASGADRERAAIAYERAKMDLAAQIRSNQDLSAEREKADKVGVEGSDEVVDAKERVRDAAEAEKEAEKGVAEAAKDLARAREDGARRVADAEKRAARSARDLADARVDAARRVQDAEQGLADAGAAIARVRRDNARSIEDAERGVEDAIRSQGRTQRDNALSVRDAQERLSDAQLAYQDALQQTAEIGSASMQRLQEAMDNLSPAGQRFARFLYSLAPYWKELRFAAQEGMLPGVQEFMTDMMNTYGPDFLRFVGEMSKTLGDLFVQMGETFKGPIMTDFFSMMNTYSHVFTEQVVGVLLNLMELVAALATAFAPFGESLGDALLRITEGWAEWAHGLKDSERFQAFLDYASESGGAFLDMLVALGAALINIGKGLAPYADIMVNWAEQFFTWLAEADSETIGKIAAAVISMLVGMQLAAGAMSSLGFLRTFFKKGDAGGFANPLGLFLMTATALVGLGTILALEYEWFADALEWVGEQLAKVGDWMADHKAELALLTLAVMAAYGAWRVYNAVMSAWIIAGPAAKAAIRGVGLAMRFAFGWIGLIVVALVALGAGLVWLYQNNETFRDGVQAIWGSIKDAFFAVVDWAINVGWPALVNAWNWMVGALAWGWENILWPVLQALGAAALWVWEEVLQPAFAAIGGAFGQVGEVFTSIWTNILRPVFVAIGDLVGWLWEFWTVRVFPTMLVAFDILATGIQLAWKMIIQPAIMALAGIVLWLWEHAISPALTNIGNAFDFLWNFWVSPLLDLFMEGLDLLGQAAVFLYEAYIKPGFTDIGDIIEWVWDNVIDPAFTAIKRGMTAVGDAFDSGAGFIGSIWAGIVAAIGGPIESILSWIKRHFVDPLNDLLGKVGIGWKIPFPDIPSVPSYTYRPPARRGGGGGGGGRAAAYSVGGIIPGYSPGHDNRRFHSPLGTLDLSGGEAIMRPEFTRVVGKGWVDKMNGAAIAGGTDGVQRALAFRQGGTIDYDALMDQGGHDFVERIGNLRILNADPKPKSWLERAWGAVTNIGGFIADPIGKMKDLVKSLLDKIPGAGTLPAEFLKGTFGTIAGKAADKIKGIFDSGSPEGLTAGGASSANALGFMRQIQHIKSMFPGAGISSSLRPGAITASGYRSYHGLGRAIDITGSRALMEKIYWYLVSNFGKQSPEIYFGPGGWAQRYGRTHYLQGVTAATHPFNHVHWAHAKGGVRGDMMGGTDWGSLFGARESAGFTGEPNVGVYDQGGLVAPGDIGINLGRRPEAFLDPIQTEALQRLADKGFGGGGVTYAPVLTSVQGATAQDISDKLNWDFKKLQRNHRYGRRG